MSLQCFKVISITEFLPSDFRMFKNFSTKHVPENRTPNWLQNSRLDFTAKEIWPPNSPKLNPWISMYRGCLKSVTGAIQYQRWLPNSWKCWCLI